MNPHQYKTAYDLAGTGDVKRWYDLMSLPIIEAGNADSGATLAQAAVEVSWIKTKRPYYTVYPVAADSLRKIELDIPCDQVKLPLESLLIRFGEGHEPLCNGEKLRSILVGTLPVRWAVGEFAHCAGLSCWMDFGEIEPELSKVVGYDMPIYKYVQFPLIPEKSVEFAISKIPHNDPDEDQAIREGLRFVLGICLLASDPEVIKPDVLSKDRANYDWKPTQEIVDRAHRRGKIGWLVGADWEMIPHYRRPHFALRWTGEGRKVAKIVPVKGAVVHRTKLSEVPEGYLDRTDS